ncbi:acyltransferase [Bradyrhizobium sp. 143]|nr:acyltransferase [Bradyrhizobium sp. 143]MCK1730883.1 acyltransferase [Bradyrhizobium sp. 142]
MAYFHSWHVAMQFPKGTDYPIPFLQNYGGYTVDFFFAIGGFVICMVVTKPRFEPVPFLIRRAFRLYPLWIVTSFVLVYIYAKYLGWPPDSTYAFFVYSLTLLPTNGYPFYDLGWSLQHEMAFYVIASLLTPRLGLPGLISFLVIGTVCDLTFDLPWYLHRYAFFYPNFLAGIAAFLLFRRLKPAGFLLPFLLGIGALYAANYWGGRIGFQLGWFLLLIGFVNIRFNPDSIAERVGIALGDASYSIYLFHALVFSYVYAKLGASLPPLWTQEPIRYGCIALVGGLAVLSWRLFETPMNALGARLASLANARFTRQQLD